MSQFDLDVVLLHNIENEPDRRPDQQEGWVPHPFLPVKVYEDTRTGLNPDVLLSLLDKIGAEGTNPTMASILFRAGIERPVPAEHELYSTASPDGHDDEFTPTTKMHAIYLHAGQRPGEEPDALIYTEGTGRKPFRGHTEVQVNTWMNKSKLAGTEQALLDPLDIEAHALRQIFTNHPHDFYGLFVEQDTVLQRIGINDPRLDNEDVITVEELGIQPEDYASVRAHGPLGRMAWAGKHTAEFYGQPELLASFSNLFEALALDVESIDMEGGEHYDYTLTDTELADIKSHVPFFEGHELITGISLDLEEVTPSWGDDGWGDMTIQFRIQKGPIVTNYTLGADMDVKCKNTWLHKNTVKHREHTTWVAQAAADMLAAMQDPQEAETNLNEIDEFEYAALVKLVATMAERLAVN